MECLRAALLAIVVDIAEVARRLDRQWAVVWRRVVKGGFDVDKYRG